MAEKVILALVDGMTGCGHPFVKMLLDASAHDLHGQTVFPSVTLPCHMSLFHSVDPDRHGILTNDYTPMVRPIVDLTARLDAYGRKCAFFYTWEELRDLTRMDRLHTSLCLNQHKQPDTDTLITDAAIRYIRYTGDTVPGSVDRIFSFGMSGGGGQSALLGATGDSELYTPYLVSDRRGQRRQRRGGGLDVLVPHHQPGLCQRGIRVEPRGNQNRLERGHAGAFRCHGGAVCLVSQCIGADRY